MRTLVLGAGGQLGSELVRLLPDAVGLTHGALSITDRAGLDRVYRKYRPELVFNCAAFNAVDRAEAEPDIAFKVNSEGPGSVSRACREYGARLVHFSTNFVFDGWLDRPYTESDPAQPASVYGKSKLEGEKAVMQLLPEALVIRTAAVFGDQGSAVKGGSFPERIVERARRGEKLKVVSDQLINPTYARDLARAAIDLEASEMAGIVHVVADGCCSWADFALAAIAACGLDVVVEAVRSADLVAPAQRPLNGCLASMRTAALRPWQEGLSEWVSNRATGSAP